MVLIFLTIGVLILFMAIFNYTSMSIAQTSYRAKEMATRRLLGSSKKSIFWRMIAESFLLTTLAFVIGFYWPRQQSLQPWNCFIHGLTLWVT